MDFQKAFDKVPHRRLVGKIESYGMAGEISEWVEAFLSNRTQKVCVNGKSSPWAEVTSGIPQGSVIGPVLFIMYINDLPEVVKNEVYLFADDTKIYSKIGNITDSVSLQSDLNSLSEWANKWLLAYHPDKCKVLRLGNRKDEPYDYMLESESLTHTHSEKDLGVLIDDKLKLGEHIDQKVNKANKITGVISCSFPGPRLSPYHI